jgi:hypothetical protein
MELSNLDSIKAIQQIAELRGKFLIHYVCVRQTELIADLDLESLAKIGAKIGLFRLLEGLHF